MTHSGTPRSWWLYRTSMVFRNGWASDCFARTVVDSTWTAAGRSRACSPGGSRCFVLPELSYTRRVRYAGSPRPTPGSGICSKDRIASTRLRRSSRRQTSGQVRSSCIEFEAICRMREATRPRRNRIIVGRSLWRSDRARRRSSCALRPALPACGAARASAPKLANCSRRRVGRFTEGFDTPVLRNAKVLLDELA